LRSLRRFKFQGSNAVFFQERTLRREEYLILELAAPDNGEVRLRHCVAFEYKVSPRQVISTNPSKRDKM
jgi:hypothetical protein